MKVYGALHLHSAYSYDAKLTLPELKAFFKSVGLSFALMTEHTDEMQKEEAEAFIKECRALSDQNFVFVPGFEVPYQNTHVLMIGADAFYTGNEIEALHKFKEAATRAVLAHPHKHGYRVDDVLRGVIDGVEVWNSQYDGKYIPRSKSLNLFTQLAKESSLHAFAGWDFHRVEHIGGPRILLELDNLSEINILAKIRSGAFLLEGRGAVVKSDGSIISGGGWGVSFLGRIAIVMISFGKRVNALLSYVGLRPPKSLRRIIRRFF